jgi:hypothetical protein
MTTPVSSWRIATLAGMLAALVMALWVQPASAQMPQYRLYVTAADDITPGLPLSIQTMVENLGDTPLVGTLTITETFPVGVAPVDPVLAGTVLGSPSCLIAGQVSTCTLDVNGLVPGAQTRLVYNSAVDPSASGVLVNTITASGGGVPQPRTVTQTMTVGPPGPFQIKDFALAVLDGNRDPQSAAGSTPSEVANSLTFRTFNAPAVGTSAPAEHLKDTVVHVPDGLIGNPTAVPRCTADQFTTASPGNFFRIPACPPESQVGVAHLHTTFGPDEVPIFNLVPPMGSPAAFGFEYTGITVVLTARLRPSDNGIDIVARDAPSTLPVAAVEVTLWGTPADSSHNYVRSICLQTYQGNFQGRVCPSSAPRTSFLRLPTSCGDPLPWSADLTTYTHPNMSEAVHAETTSPAMTGCEALPFSPAFSLAPAHLTPETPTGLDATLQLPQETSPDGLATADLKDATVTLPVGVSLNPASAGGLQACTDAELKLGVEGAATCPEASKIGTVSLTTPLIDHPLSGSIFLRPQESMDPASGKLFRIAVEIRSDDDGIDIKLPAAIRVDPHTGQLTTVIENAPQLPFSSFTLHFKDGPRAALATPTGCGTFTTTATFDSWSGKTVSTTSSFGISGDGHGSSCAAPGFAPVIKAGTVNPVANAFSPFTLQLTRTDSDQQLASISPLRMPSGVLANIGSVPRCTDAQAAAASCPDSSRLGNVTVGAGAGPNPFYVTDGNVYLTGPYRGAPFGLAFVVHATAGPFDLGTVVVRAALQIDPATSQAVIESDPFPTILAGVPLRLRDIRVTIDRPHFMFNPSGCGEQNVTATVNSTAGAHVPVSDRFQVGDCASLHFHPSFSASTQGKTSKANGASLLVHLATHEGPTNSGGESNIAKVDVQLPVSLPARLTTLQKACTAAQFASNPAGCPQASFVGTGVARTPILASPLSGPAILVSHGGQAFPDLVLVLQGEGVQIDLTGHTQIKKGITYSRFETVPDAPVSSFDLTLPQGSHSALTTDVPGRNLCTNTKTVTVTKRVTRRVNGHNRKVTVKAKKAVTAPLSMPTTITAQNGAVVSQSTNIAVTGCAKKAAKAKPKKHAKKNGKAAAVGKQAL